MRVDQQSRAEDDEGNQQVVEFFLRVIGGEAQEYRRHIKGNRCDQDSRQGGSDDDRVHDIGAAQVDARESDDPFGLRMPTHEASPRWSTPRYRSLRLTNCRHTSSALALTRHAYV